MAKKKPSARAERRAADRSAEKLSKDRERLARLEPGGTPRSPIQVQSASIIEPHALGQRCLRCDASCRIEEHAAVEAEGARVRRLTLRCGMCGAPRVLYFCIALPS